MKILFKYPTRERPYWFLRGLDNICSTLAKDTDYEILVTVDNDDLSMNNQMVIDKANAITKNITWNWGFSRNKVHAINRGIEKAKSNWEVLINMSDDMLFQYPEWNIDMEELIKSKWGGDLDFFAHFDDGYTGEAIPSMSIIGRKYFQRTGRIYPYEYNSLWADNHVKDEAIILGRYHYFPNVIYKHYHPANAGIEQDNLYKFNESFYYIDKQIYEQFKADNFGL